MTTTDIILLICFLPAIISGLSKGLVKQLVSIAAIFAGAFIASKFSLPVGEFISGLLKDARPQVVKVISFALIFFAALVVFGLLGNLLTKIMKFASLSWLNRLLGMVFGIFKAALILAVLVWLFDDLNAKWNLVKPETLNDSIIFTYLKDFGAKFFPFLKNLISQINA